MRRVLEEKLGNFRRNDKGSFAILFALVAILLAFAVGSVVDYTNFRAAQREVRSALDSAGLAAARELDAGGTLSDEVKRRAKEIFQVNLQKSKLVDVDATVRTLQFSQAPGATEVVTTADLVVPTYFAGLFGFNNLSTRMQTSAGFEREISEFAFVLDNTGSMAASIRGTTFPRNERIDALRSAMRGAIDLLLPVSGENDELVRVGIVPYSNAVNLGGTYYPDAVSEFTNVFSRTNTCATEREGIHQTDDIAPLKNIENATVANQPAVRARFYETDRDLRDGNSDSCPNVAIRPLTNDRNVLLQDVAAFTPRGGTAGHIGIEWGFNLLSENWQDFWPAASRPADYKTRNVRKVLVIMTDGEFNVQYFDGIRRPTRTSDAIAASNAAARRFCDLAKASDRAIEVYTVALGPQVADGRTDTAANILLRDCASPDISSQNRHFLTATSVSELNAAFASIVKQQINPVLTQ